MPLNFRQWRIRLAVLAGAACVLVLGLALLLIPSPNISGPRISLISITQTVETSRSAHGPTATFTVNNPSRRRITYFVADAQLREGHAWSKVSLAPAPAGTSLGENESAQFSLAAPTNGTAWRVPIFWVFEPTDFEAWRGIAQAKWRTFRETASLKGALSYSLTARTNYSEEIAPPAASTPEPAANGTLSESNSPNTMD